MKIWQVFLLAGIAAVAVSPAVGVFIPDSEPVILVLSLLICLLVWKLKGKQNVKTDNE